MAKERIGDEPATPFEVLTQPTYDRRVAIPLPVRFEKRKLIALAGPAYCGKDTVAAILKKQFPVKSVAFADPIRDALRAMLGLNDDHFFGHLKEVDIPWLGKSPRKLMQTLGTEWGRGLIHEDLWLLIAGRKINDLMASGYHAVVTDCRFENEAAYIRNQGGVIWHIERNGTKSVSAHKSEAGVAFAWGDVKIDNNGTLSDLEDEVSDCF